MRKISKRILLAALMTMQVTLLMSPGAVRTANAGALAGFSPNDAIFINPGGVGVPPDPAGPVAIKGIPAWFQGQDGVAVKPCLDVAKCVLLGAPDFNAALPLSFPSNFPSEAFYFNATNAKFALGTATATVVMALEYTFLSPLGALIPASLTAVGNPFQRLRLDETFIGGGGVLPAAAVGGSFTVVTPWGTAVFPASSAKCINQGGDTKCSMTRDQPVAGPNPTAALGDPVLAPGSISTFLRDPTAPAGFLGLGAAVTAFVGAPAGNLNQITITDALGQTATSTVLSTLTGHMFGMQVAPTGFVFGANLITTPPTTTPATTITVTNPNTVSSLTLGPLALTGPNLADFIIAADTCSNVTLPVALAAPAPPSTCTFTVAFAPKPLAPAPEVAARTATVNIPGTFAPVAPATVGLAVPPGVVTLSGTAQLPVTATADPTGAITGPAVTAKAADAGSAQVYTVTPNAKWEVKAITVNGTAQNITAIKPADPTKPVTFTAPALSAAQTINASFMPSGDLTGDGKLDISDALKGLKIFVGLLAPQGDDAAAMKVTPLDANGLPPASAGAAPATPADLNDVVLILRRILGVVTW